MFRRTLSTLLNRRIEKHLCHPPFFFRTLTVRSRHNPRLFMTKGTIELLEMRQH